MYGISGKQFFFQNFNTFFCFVNDLSVIFGFLTQKLKTKMHYCKFPRWPLTGQKRRTVVQTFNCNISETIWDRTLKFGTFTYLHIMYICSKSHWNLERWVSGIPLWCGISPKHKPGIWPPPTNVKIITWKYSNRYWSITRRKLNTRNTPCKEQIRYYRPPTAFFLIIQEYSTKFRGKTVQYRTKNFQNTVKSWKIQDKNPENITFAWKMKIYNI